MLVISILFLACEKERLTADGNILTEIRTPAAFRGVHSSGSNTVSITYGNEYKVEVRGSANLVQRYRAKTVNGILHLGYEHVSVRDDDIAIFITMPVFERISMSGSGNVNIYDSFPVQDELLVTISGSSDVKFHNLLRYNRVHVTISGSGDADMEDVQCDRSDIRISGSGDARIHVDEHLKVRVSGSGKVQYSGNPVLDSEISGSGSVTRLR